MLFGVSDWIQDIMRRFGIVRRIRFIYGKSYSGFRKSSGIFPVSAREFLEGSGGATCGPHDLERTKWTEGMLPSPHGPGAWPQPSRPAPLPRKLEG